MSQCYDIQDVIADQLADLPAQDVAEAVIGALQGHESEAEALRLLAERISVRLTQTVNASASPAQQGSTA